MGRFSIDAIGIEAISMSTKLVLSGLGSASHALGIETAGAESGAPYRESRHQTRRNETVSFSTFQLEAILDQVGFLQGFCVDADGTHEGLELFGQQHSRCGVGGRTAGSTHRKTTAALAHLMINSISWTAGSYATVELMAVLLSTDGVTKPSVTVYNAPLLTPLGESFFQLAGYNAADIPQQFLLGNVALDLDDIESVTLNSGIDYEVLFGVNRFATDIDIKKSRPTLEIATKDASIVAAAKIPEAGLVCTTANSHFGFQKLAADGSLFDPQDTEHILCEFSGYAMVDDAFNASNAETSSSKIMVELTGTLGSPPVVLTTASALRGS